MATENRPYELDPMTQCDTSSAGARGHHYEVHYRKVASEAEWLRRGAGDKVDSIERLLERNEIRPETVLELGCGTGAVIAECRRRGIGSRHVAVDFAEAAIDYLNAQTNGIEGIVADVTSPGFSMHGEYDVVIASHVLEHLPDPRAFLERIGTQVTFRYAVIEVPLEDLLVSRLRWLGRDRTNNKAAHLQFFTVRSFARLLSAARFRTIDQRLYAPVLDLDTVRFICRKDGITGPRRILKPLTSHYLPKTLAPLWKRFYYAHYAVLCTTKWPARGAA